MHKYIYLPINCRQLYIGNQKNKDHMFPFHKILVFYPSFPLSKQSNLSYLNRLLYIPAVLLPKSHQEPKLVKHEHAHTHKHENPNHTVATACWNTDHLLRQHLSLCVFLIPSHTTQRLRDG